MKSIRTLLLLGLAAMLGMAFFGVGSATASEGFLLCLEKEEPCAPEFRYIPPTNLETQLKEGTEAVFKTDLGSVACKKSGFGLETTEDGVPLLGQIKSMSFGECVLGKAKCTAIPVNLPYEAQIKNVEGGNGLLNMTKGGAGEPGVEVVCGGGANLKCTFSGEPQLPMTGGKPAVFKTSAENLKRAGALCPKETAELVAVYVGSNPSVSTYASKGKTTLCTTNAKFCSAGNTYPKETEVEAIRGSSAPEFVTNAVTVKCGEAFLLGETGDSAAQGLPLTILAAEFTTCNDGLNNCNVFEVPAIGEGRIHARGGGSGRLAIKTPWIKFTCGLRTCEYNAALWNLDLNGGSPAEIIASAEKMALHSESGLLSCSAEMKFSENYQVVFPEPLYVSG